MTPEEIVNLDAYPIADRNAPERKELIARLRNELEEKQYVSLPDFIRPEAREQAVADALEALPRAHPNCADRSCYLHRQGDPAFPPDHARNILLKSSMRMLAYDRFSDESPVKTLYHWAPVREMVSEIVGADQLFDSADSCQPVNLLCYAPGDQSAWHFDSDNAFTMTLMLQAADEGGEFEMVPNTRSDDDQNYDYVARVVSGRTPEDAVAVAREVGSLCIFRGCNSVHRVSPVKGERTRIMAVFVYEAEPNVVGDPKVNETIYGRAV